MKVEYTGEETGCCFFFFMEGRERTVGMRKENWEEQLGSETDCATQGSSAGKESLKTSCCNNLWGFQQWEKLPASQESSLERPTGS